MTSTSGSSPLTPPELCGRCGASLCLRAPSTPSPSPNSSSANRCALARVHHNVGLFDDEADVVGNAQFIPDRLKQALKSVDAMVRSALQARGITAASIGVVYDQELIWQQGYGRIEPASSYS